MIELAFLIVISLVCLLEACHDGYVIKGSDPNKVRENGLWHRYDFAIWILVYLTLSISLQDIRYFLYAGLLRQFCMQVVLNLRLGRPTFYLSSKGIDKWLRDHIGQEAVGVGCFVLSLALGAWIIAMP